ncbi:MAG: asparagine synthase (glutamine-hydrolyzing), partial [Myxococcales bacterium]|nr:asparagine synthase (glutamine-hydrolyzing) [Myxococcales bacterium]
FRSRSDTEVVLLLLAREGEAGLSRLRGMFALALFDPRAGSVLLARDRLGIKPLYLSTRRTDGGAVTVFASEVRALLESGLVARRIDPVGLGSYLHNGFAVGPHTLIRDVTLLPAGTSVRVPLDGPPSPPKRFWRLPPHASIDEADAVMQLERALTDAVRLRLVSDVPLGIFLSGGIDSSAIASLAMRGRRADDEPVTTFNIAFDEARYDESPHARAVAEQLGTKHHEVKLSQSSFRAGLGDALQSLDQPTFDAINTYFVSAAVREAGLTVALAGTGGDELFGGYSSFRDIPRALRAASAARSVPAPLLRGAGQLVSRFKNGKPGAVPPQTRWGKLPDALVTGGDVMALYQVSYGLFTSDFLENLASGNDGVRDGMPIARAGELEALVAGQPDLHAISQLELSLFLGERLLRDTDTASMAVSLEVRVPLIDHEVVDALSHVPLARRFEPLQTKQLLRELAMPQLDPVLFDRPKAGFELPLDVWIRDELKGALNDTMNDRRLCAQLGLDGEAVARLLGAFLDDAPGLYWSRVWALYILLWWCREHDVHA